MNPLHEIGLIVSRELRKNLRSAKGIVLLLLSLMGGTLVAILIVSSIERTMAEQMASLPITLTVDQRHEQLRQFQEMAFAKMYGDEAMGHYLGGAPLPLVAMFLLSVWLAPLLVALTGFDAISSEVQNRAVRFWTLRVRRSSYFVGKFLGTWAAISTITFVMSAVMWTVTIARGSYGVGTTLSWGLRFWVISLPLSAAWCAIATFVASLFRTPILGLLTTFMAFFVVWLFGFAIPIQSKIMWLQYLYPNNYDSWLMSPHPARIASALGGCLLFVLVPIVSGALLFRQRDV